MLVFHSGSASLSTFHLHSTRSRIVFLCLAVAAARLGLCGARCACACSQLRGRDTHIFANLQLRFEFPQNISKKSNNKKTKDYNLVQYLMLNWVKWFLERWIHIVPTMTCWDVARHEQQRTIEELSRLASLALPARFSSNIHFSLLRISFSLRLQPSQEQDGSVHRQWDFVRFIVVWDGDCHKP